ncbi:MAG: hypothetical protein RBT22_12480 [Aliarcobacter sp.]|jgi:hypothetical protein|nr:hypothetical protein [Aliarcobacter sp.]
MGFGDIFKFFENTTKIKIYTNHNRSIVIPKELDNNKYKDIDIYYINIENYSNKNIKNISVNYEFNKKFESIVLDKNNKELSFKNKSDNILLIDNINPKTEIHIFMYPKEEEFEKPIIYIDGNLLDYKTKIHNFIYDLFKSKAILILLPLIGIPILSVYYTTQSLYIFDEKTNEMFSKSEFIDKKQFELYEKQNLKPNLVELDVIIPPTNFYKQQDLEKKIKEKCDAKYILDLNNVTEYKELFKLEKIVICK